VSGGLPLREALATADSSTAFVRCLVEVTTAGKLGIDLQDSRGLTLWVDGTPTKVGAAVPLELAQGIHELTFRVDLKQRPDALLHCELTDLAGSAAQANFVARR
jgi:hypothetical protein